MRRYVFWVNLGLTAFGWWCVYIACPLLDFPVDCFAAGVFAWSMISLWLLGRKVK